MNSFSKESPQLNFYNFWELLTFESDKIQLQAKQYDVVQLVKNCTNLFHSLAEQKKIALHFLSKIDSLVLYVDKDKIENALYTCLPMQ
ncbi:MAG: hypothetical protein JSW07_00345 [bacterium]|nr:MAG: hypothetical protein JSW07_00345 [bacterium]